MKEHTLGRLAPPNLSVPKLERERTRSTCLRKVIPFLAPLLLAAPDAAFSAQVTVDLNPIDDTTIYQGVDPDTGENFENNSCGAGTNLFSGKTSDGLLRRALFRFDVSGIPADASILSVDLIIDVNRSGDNQDATMTVHRLTTDWVEGAVNCDPIRGGGQGAPADPGDTTWQFPWTTPGGDFNAASASALIPTRGTGTWTDSTQGDGLVADVQAWKDGTANNFGFIVIGDESRSSTTRRFWSREGSTPPILKVTYLTLETVSACCFPDDGSCQLLTLTSCSDAGGTSNPSAICNPNPCPQPSGACCNADESCSDSVEAATCLAGGGIFQGTGTLCSQGSVDCGLEPFVDALPVPGVLLPVGTRADGVPQYQIEVVSQQQQLHRDLPSTDVWTYNGVYPGFTIEARRNEPIEVTYINNLPQKGRRGGHLLEVDECPHGPNYWSDSARIVTHLHGGHVPGRVDGHPEMTLFPGELDVYEYPNNQLPATLWYHDHALGITRLNVYAGMAGFYIIRDDFEDSLGLPSGEFEIPAAIQDREFNADGSLFYPPTIQDAFFGDKILVNGKVWPFLNVKRGKYRFRFLNGSQARPYSLRLENLSDPNQVIPFTLIGTDLGLIGSPIAVNDILIAPAERQDVVIDFGPFPVDTEIILRNDDTAFPRIPNIMKFIVTSGTGFTASLPSQLRTVPTIPQSEAMTVRWFRLEKVAELCSGNEWLIRTLDGPGGNPTGAERWDDISELPQLGSTEIWEFENPSPLMHPMHIHLVAFQVLERRNLTSGLILPLEPWEENSWKDTVRVEADTVVRVIARFEDYLGKFAYHCHILDHEDHEMMRQFRTTNDPANCNQDGTCDAREDCLSCPADCLQVSGALCGNGLCEAGDGENCTTCPSDCNGKQAGAIDRQFCCGADDGQVNNPISCGVDESDDRCTDRVNSRFCRVAARVPACCGDALCEGMETESSCALDCASPIGAGAVPDGGARPGIPLTVEDAGGGQIRLSWGSSCAAGDTDYEVYEGVLGVSNSHMPLFCSTGNATSITFTPSGEGYYLVVPRNISREGSYGLDSIGLERLPGSSACLLQKIQTSCP